MVRGVRVVKVNYILKFQPVACHKININVIACALSVVIGGEYRLGNICIFWLCLPGHQLD